MSYAAKSAMKLNDDNTKVNLISNSKSIEMAAPANFTSAEEFPPVTVYNSSKQQTASLNKPTAASLFTTT